MAVERPMIQIPIEAVYSHNFPIVWLVFELNYGNIKVTWMSLLSRGFKGHGIALRQSKLVQVYTNKNHS